MTMHSTYSRLSSFLYWGMLRRFVASTLIIVLLASCSGLGGAALSALVGSGPSVNANAQVGKTNQQGINVTSQAPTVTVRPQSRVDSIDQSTTNNVDIPPWVLLLLVIGWLAPSPGEIARSIKNLWRKE